MRLTPGPVLGLVILLSALSCTEQSHCAINTGSGCVTCVTDSSNNCRFCQAKNECERGPRREPRHPVLLVPSCRYYDRHGRLVMRARLWPRG
jgi:hypothetical protein